MRDLADDSPWQTRELLEERLCLVLPAHHALATRPEVSFDDLRRVADEPFITTHSWMAGRAPRWGFEPRVLGDVTSLQGIFALIVFGFGISFMPESYSAVRRPELVFVPVAGEISRQQIAWPPDAALPTRERFLEVVAGARGQLGGWA